MNFTMHNPSTNWYKRFFLLVAASLLPFLLATPAPGAISWGPQRPPSETTRPKWLPQGEANGFLAKKERHRDGYEDLSPQERKRLQQQYQKWRALPPEEQQKLRRRQQELEQMPPESRRPYHKRFQQWQNIPDAERQQLRRQLDNWDQLSPQEQEAIRRRFND